MTWVKQAVRGRWFYVEPPSSLRRNSSTSLSQNSTYAYDGAGNTTRFDRWNSTTNTVETVRYLYNGANQIKCVDADSSGACDGPEFIWQYDAYGNLVNDGTSTYVYDAAGDTALHHTLQSVTCYLTTTNHTHVLQGRLPVSTNFLYLALSKVQISGYITGAAQPKITQANLNRIPILIGDDPFMRRFEELVTDFLDCVDTLNHRNAALSKTRDLLLPRLISGEISVEGLPLPDEESNE